MGIPIEIRHLSNHKNGGLKTIIGPDIEATPNIKGIACIPRVAYVNAEVRYSQDAARALGDLLKELEEEDIRICSFETTNTQWRFVFLQHELSRGVHIINRHCSSVNYDYYAAMLSFIGCCDIEYLREQLAEHHDAQDMPLYESATSIHMLSKRMDISRMLDEMMAFVAPSRLD
jgi:hypothetical protein